LINLEKKQIEPHKYSQPKDCPRPPGSEKDPTWTSWASLKPHARKGTAQSRVWLIYNKKRKDLLHIRCKTSMKRIKSEVNFQSKNSSIQRKVHLKINIFKTGSTKSYSSTAEIKPLIPPSKTQLSKNMESTKTHSYLKE
jgi:hypothetical protein